MKKNKSSNSSYASDLPRNTRVVVSVGLSVEQL